MGKVDPKKLKRDIAARSRLAAHATPGLPIDGDVVETRVPMPSMGKLMDGLLATLLVEKSPFFDQVCEQWPTLFPDSVAKPGRWQDGRLFLYVRTSGQLFGMRPKLTKIKKALAALPTAPKRFSVHLEIR
jgi:hypothetical protein